MKVTLRLLDNMLPSHVEAKRAPSQSSSSSLRDVEVRRREAVEVLESDGAQSVSSERQSSDRIPTFIRATVAPVFRNHTANSIENYVASNPIPA